METKKQISNLMSNPTFAIFIGIIIGSLLTAGFIYLFEITFIDFVRSVFGFRFPLSSKVITYFVIWVLITSATTYGTYKGSRD